MHGQVARAQPQRQGEQLALPLEPQQRQMPNGTERAKERSAGALSDSAPPHEDRLRFCCTSEPVEQPCCSALTTTAAAIYNSVSEK